MQYYAKPMLCLTTKLDKSALGVWVRSVRQTSSLNNLAVLTGSSQLAARSSVARQQWRPPFCDLSTAVEETLSEPCPNLSILRRMYLKCVIRFPISAGFLLGSASKTSCFRQPGFLSVLSDYFWLLMVKYGAVKGKSTCNSNYLGLLLNKPLCTDAF